MEFDTIIKATIRVPDRTVLHDNSRGEILGFSVDGRNYRIWTTVEAEDGTALSGADLTACGVSISYDETVTEDLKIL